jgi:ABC-type bacteriocin/lantibiotic exporter with double-glycine peptidase domain
MQLPYPELQVQRIIERSDYRNGQFESFLNMVQDAGQGAEISFVRQEFTPSELTELIESLNFPLLAFTRNSAVIIYKDKRDVFVWKNDTSKTEEINSEEIKTMVSTLCTLDTLLGRDAENARSESYIFTLCPVGIKTMTGSDGAETAEGLAKTFTPLKRFFKFVASERSNIFYIYIYAVLIGLINLSLPLGIQAIIGRISGGMMFDGVIVLITFVILGLMLSGGLQLMQVYLVEILQRRIFTKAAFEFAFRIPRIRSEALLKVYPPELMNRFFDVITLQKGLSKILLDLTTAFLQIIFGLILLALYHPMFILFGLVLFSLLMLMFRITGNKALQSSIKESSRKYQIVSWFEDMARNINTFKIAGHTNMPLDQTDGYIDGYLQARKKHFSVLLNQFIYVIVFKLLVTGGTLILGCILVVEREITLGQFVASEIIIILIINAVEKLIFSIETVYDVLTAAEKIGQVSDLPLEKHQGIHLDNIEKTGIGIQAKNLTFSYGQQFEPVLKNVNFNIQPGEKVCIAGLNGSGKQTLAKILSGLLSDYRGQITINGISMRNIHLNDLHEYISLNLSGDEVFQGTVEENIRLGKNAITQRDVLNVLQQVGISDFVNGLPEGIYTSMLPGGKGWPGSAVRKLLLARSLVKKPALFIFQDLFTSIGRTEKKQLIQQLMHAKPNMTFLAISADAEVMLSCDRLIILHEGTVLADGKPNELLSNKTFSDLL